MRCPICRKSGKCEICEVDLLKGPIPELYVKGLYDMELAVFGGRLMYRTQGGLLLLPLCNLKIFMLQISMRSAFYHMRFGEREHFDAILFDDPRYVSAAVNITQYVLKYSTRNSLGIRALAEEYYPNGSYLKIIKKLKDRDHITYDEYSKLRERVMTYTGYRR